MQIPALSTCRGVRRRAHCPADNPGIKAYPASNTAATISAGTDRFELAMACTRRLITTFFGAITLAIATPACSTGGTSSPATHTSPTATISTAPSLMSTGSPTTEPGGPPMSTGTINLQSRAGTGLTEVGTDLFRLAPDRSPANPGQLSFNWSYNDGNQAVTSNNCAVIAEVSGPNGFDQQQHSTDCTGTPASPFPIAAAGLYSISVQLTPSGGSPMAATRTITVRAAGS